ncbi:pantetheine-phosphate adenylyltransferase [Massilia glaciei]|uniref:Phosphopantetheine adenylyltransferase n=1 Tax=Massilia glaciei TaxID=1524097 RepID=A0A2U2HKD7_9BURK|nr:pantetheine-phosphate adenylyltransferase [Massilia glaciei]PWF47939.1 pantetheine-phosphate adenylyltransferase [Massilia glaciei]
MKKIAFSGTLDPITNGHMWVVQEARALADEVVILISENPAKKPQFPAAERKRIVEQSVAGQGWTNVSVMLIKGDYTARAAKRLGIDYLIRGIRNTSDFDYENLIQQANVDVLHGAKTLFVMPPRDLGSVSSSFVRALQGPVGWHWTVRKFMPAPAYQAWIGEFLRKEWESLWPAGANSDHWFARLTGPEGYGGPGRHYHNLDHLLHGLSEIGVWAANTDASQGDMQELKKAFWFHDAVMRGPDGAQPDAQSDEERSAALWLGAELDAADADGPAALIRATAHLGGGAAAHRLKGLMLGADLAILGQADGVYDAYARAVRAEYAHLDEAAYRGGRARVLRHFCDMARAGTLYRAPYFAGLYQHKALENMTREIAGLDGDC